MVTANNKIIIYGLSGTGKTVSLHTLPLKTHKVCVMALENNCLVGLRVLQKQLTPEQLENFHVMRINPKPQGLASLITSANDVLKKSPDALKHVSDPKRREYDSYVRLLQGMQEFTNMQGSNIGSIETWDSSYILVIDSLTTVCSHIYDSIIGGATFVSQPAWLRMQMLLQRYLRYLVDSLQCHVILLGHAIIQTNSLTDLELIYPSTVGKALKDLVPTFFSEVIYSYRQGTKYYWSPSHLSAVTATRSPRLEGRKQVEQNYNQFDW